MFSAPVKNKIGEGAGRYSHLNRLKYYKYLHLTVSVILHLPKNIRRMISLKIILLKAFFDQL